jgi:hypothetical protein
MFIPTYSVCLSRLLRLIWHWPALILCTHGAFEPPVLLLEFLELLRRIGRRPAVLSPPAVKRLLADRQLLTDLRDRHAAVEKCVRLTQLGDNLLRIVLLAFHRKSPRPVGP